MMPRKLYYRRVFLNKPGYESIGLALGEVRMDVSGDMDADLTIGDCGRQATLNFSIYWGRGEHRKVDHKDIANLRHKSAELRKVVNEFLDAVEAGLDIIEKGDQ